MLEIKDKHFHTHFFDHHSLVFLTSYGDYENVGPTKCPRSSSNFNSFMKKVA